MRLSIIYGIPIRELQQRITSSEFAELIAYDRIEPLPDSWQQMATLAAILVNAHRSKGPPAKPADFIPSKQIRPKIPTRSQQMAMIRSLAQQ